jgi:hypothetical protein
MLAAPFTRENAAEMARRATISREANRHAKLLAVSPDYANSRAVKQVNRVLSWMEQEKNRDKYAELVAMLDRLWNKAYPTQGARRPKDHRQRQEPIQPL